MPFAFPTYSLTLLRAWAKANERAPASAETKSEPGQPPGISFACHAPRE